MAIQHTARTGGHKDRLTHLTVEPGEKGGAVVRRHMSGDGFRGGYEIKRIFGKHEGADLKKHLFKHLQMEDSQESEEE